MLIPNRKKIVNPSFSLKTANYIIHKNNNFLTVYSTLKEYSTFKHNFFIIAIDVAK